MLAKVVAHGPTRDAACRTLARALADARLHGVVTNRDLLVGVLREEEFRRGDIDTGYLERHDPAALATRPDAGRARVLHAVAATLAGAAERRAAALVQRAVPSGWRNVPSGDQVSTWTCGGRELEVRYRWTRAALEVAVDGERLAIQVPAAPAVGPEQVVLVLDGVRRAVEVHRVGATVWCDSALGSTELTEVPRFREPREAAEPGSLHAPMPGTVVRVEVEPGRPVAAGAVVLVLEAMKMEHAVRAPAEGVVTALPVAAGESVAAGQLLAVVAGPDGVAP
jgi:acetyl/propionyl-CoA carboxylase alpha subunit